MTASLVHCRSKPNAREQQKTRLSYFPWERTEMTFSYSRSARQCDFLPFRKSPAGSTNAVRGKCDAPWLPIPMPTAAKFAERIRIQHLARPFESIELLRQRPENGVLPGEVKRSKSDKDTEHIVPLLRRGSLLTCKRGFPEQQDGVDTIGSKRPQYHFLPPAHPLILYGVARSENGRRQCVPAKDRQDIAQMVVRAVIKGDQWGSSGQRSLSRERHRHLPTAGRCNVDLGISKYLQQTGDDGPSRIRFGSVVHTLR